MVRRKILYIVGLAAMFAMTVLYYEYEPFALLIMYILFPIVLRICLAISKANVSVKFATDIEDYVNIGDEVHIILGIKERIWIPNIYKIKVKVSYNNYGKTEIVQLNQLKRKDNKVFFDMIIKCKHCGKITIGTEEITAFDSLGLFKSRIKDNIAIDIVVMPEINYIDYEFDTSDNMQDDNTSVYSASAGDDTSEIYDIRAYMAGDKLNRIHWKLSVKEGGLMTKNYASPTDVYHIISPEIIQAESEEDRYKLDMLYAMTLATANSMLEQNAMIYIAYHNETTDESEMLFAQNKEVLMDVISGLIANAVPKNGVDNAVTAIYDPSKQYILHYLTFEDEDIVTYEPALISTPVKSLVIYSLKEYQHDIDSREVAYD